MTGDTTSPACRLAPRGWHCTRSPGHDGPCAAWVSWWNVRDWWPRPDRVRGWWR